MYALIIVIAVLSPATGAVTPVGVTSQIVGKFKNLDQCKAAASERTAGGVISDLEAFQEASTGIAPMRAPSDFAKSVRGLVCRLVAHSGHP